ncbi:LytTR family DNA-binding domain-containing protein [Mucilaginibacter sp. cycad4]|uniref:LytR/AlgR family response regulator transcription factor n=1 Tax=Mucilaginibacter sp. cycad4 TaxID=3342096 RepID=UPI002AAACFF5|nr:LytTR family DNA-binding domain-containing protein [Mucilaginibacter gossypii]WPV01549.1 LytTR family DNA-binding domain-containing protein [Mucilaginibacter gossypii]
MNVLIIEDEARIAKRLARMARAYFEQQLTLTLCDTLSKGLEFMEHSPVDVLLLDLNLNGEDGFEVLETMVARPFHTIIVSAYTDKAITAFSYGVLDFVPKPFDEGRLFQAFGRLNTRSKISDNGLKYLAVRKGGMIKMIKAIHLNYIKGAGIYSELHLEDGNQELHDKSLDALEQLLPPGEFTRIHRSYIVSLKQVEKLVIEPGGKYAVRLTNGRLLPVGRSRYKELRSKMI